MPEEELITYEVVCSPTAGVFRADQTGDLRRITVPKSWRVSFGPIAPRAPEMIIRVWDGKNLRMVIRDVESLRDTTVDYRVKKAEAAEWEELDIGEHNPVE